MLPSAVVDQQAKLGVSTEESKAQRLKRQQARFRDRGGAFVPSNSNPLVNILLARTVSGESPSKVRPKDAAAKRLSLSKAQASPTRKATVPEESQAVARSSRSKPQASRKQKAKAVESEADTATKPAPKRRGRPAKGKKKVLDPDSETEQPPFPNAKNTSKGKGKRRTTSTATSTSDGNLKSKLKPKPKTKAKSNLAKEVVEVHVSDDDQTLVEVPRKVKSNPKRIICEDGETDDDIPIVRIRAIPPVNDSKSSATKPAKSIKKEGIAGAGSSGKKALEDVQERTQDDKSTKTTAKKRLVPHDDDDDVVAPPTKKGKAAAKPKLTIEQESAPAPRTNKDVKDGEKSKPTGKGKGKGRAEPDQDDVVLMEEDADEQPPERVSKPKKRKEEEDNCDDRPRKVVKFSETGPPHSSSQKLKENQFERKRKSVVKPSVEDEPDAARIKLATKAPRAKTPKGPPLEVLERIKASAARYLRCADNEPDELDCLS